MAKTRKRREHLYWMCRCRSPFKSSLYLYLYCIVFVFRNHWNAPEIHLFYCPNSIFKISIHTWSWQNKYGISFFSFPHHLSGSHLGSEYIITVPTWSTVAISAPDRGSPYTTTQNIPLVEVPVFSLDSKLLRAGILPVPLTTVPQRCLAHDGCSINTRENLEWKINRIQRN